MRETNAKLGKLAATATTKPKASKSEERQILTLPTETQNRFGYVCQLVHCNDRIQKELEQEKGTLNQEVMDLWTQQLWDSGQVPKTPNLQLDHSGRPDCTGQFIVQGASRFKVHLPPSEENVAPEDQIVQMLTDVGLPENKAIELVKNEIDCNPGVTTQSLTYLTEGHYASKNEWIPATEAEKVAGNKLLDLILLRADGRKEIKIKAEQLLTDEEGTLAILRLPKTVVNKDFFSHLKKYCENITQLRSVLKVIQPVFYLQKMNFGVNSTEDSIKERLYPVLENLQLVPHRK